MIFSFYDFAKIGWFNNPFQVGNKRSTAFVVHPTSKKFGCAYVGKEFRPPGQNILACYGLLFGKLCSHFAPALA
jgi:hypothetical protein